MLEVGTSITRETQLWIPEERLKQPRNQQALQAILPLETIVWVEHNGFPEAQHAVSGYPFGGVAHRTKKQLSRISDSTPLQPVFSVEPQKLELEEVPEEILVRSLIRGSLYATLFIASRFLKDPAPENFLAADSDISKILGTVKRPVFPYESLGFYGKDFIGSIINSAEMNQAIKGEDDRLEILQKYVRAVLPTVTSRLDAARKISAHNGFEVPAELLARRNGGRILKSELQTQPSKPEKQKVRHAGPRLSALFSEYNFSGNGDVSVAENGIERLSLANLEVANILSEPGTVMMIGRTAILAYLEELDGDAYSQSATISPNAYIERITQRREGLGDYGSDQRRDKASIERISMIANTMAEITRRKTGAQIDPFKGSIGELPRAFRVIRYCLTNFGIQPIVESESTKLLGDHVEEILSYATKL